MYIGDSDEDGTSQQRSSALSRRSRGIVTLYVAIHLGGESNVCMCFIVTVLFLVVAGLTQSLAGRHRQPSLFNTPSSVTITSQRGVVYFSKVGQLRAALKEMQNYRLVTRGSRGKYSTLSTM